MLARASFNYSIFMVWRVEDKGIEPLTLGLQSQCSPTELIPLVLDEPGDCSGRAYTTAEAAARGAGRSLKTK